MRVGGVRADAAGSARDQPAGRGDRIRQQRLAARITTPAHVPRRPAIDQYGEPGNANRPSSGRPGADDIGEPQASVYRVGTGKARTDDIGATHVAR